MIAGEIMPVIYENERFYSFIAVLCPPGLLYPFHSEHCYYVFGFGSVPGIGEVFRLGPSENNSSNFIAKDVWQPDHPNNAFGKPCVIVERDWTANYTRH